MSKRRPATAADIVFGATIHYKHGDDGPFTRTVEEVLRPSDPYKAFSADDGCRYGLDDAYVDVMTDKLDVEGIRERVKKDSVQIILDPEVAPVPPDGVVYFDFTVNLLAEIGRLRSELMAARKHMIQAAAECAREQGGMWESEEYPSSKAELRSKADSAARFVSNLAMWLKDKGARQ